MQHSSADQPGTTTVDVVVVGGGLAGLSAANFAARSGASVRVLDARNELGGRARTAVDGGFHFNEGPHALYRAGAGMAALRELGIAPAGGNPPFARSRLSIGGELVRVPPRRATQQVLGLVRGLRADASDLGLVNVTAAEWIDARVSDPVGRRLAAALVRVSSYSGDLTTFSADGAARQARSAMRGVMYLHDGWAQLVRALTVLATSSGVAIERGAKVESVHADGHRWTVTTGTGDQVNAAAVVIAAGGPTAASRLLGGASPTLELAAEHAKPVHAACLDLGLRSLPRTAVRFVLGVDRPTYASIHTPGAKLAAPGRHVAHVMHYEPTDDVDLATLELHADELQPGWRDHEEARQVGHRRVVAYDRPQPGSGMDGRPAIDVPDLPGILVAGDWVGPDDLLGGASLASGRAAGRAAAAVGSRPIASAR